MVCNRDRTRLGQPHSHGNWQMLINTSQYTKIVAGVCICTCIYESGDGWYHWDNIGELGDRRKNMCVSIKQEAVGDGIIEGSWHV